MEWADPIVRSLFSKWVSPDSIRRPSALWATVCLELYAPFEFQPMLGAGELLRKLTITVEQLLDHSAKDVREWDGVFHESLVLTSCHHGSVLPLPEGWGRCIPVFIHFGHYQTAEFPEQ
jgi:hypothetical protein